ncbi:MAG: CHAT domain-containing protein, partial [Planctomycetales bacterium]|nr:CHAT domain-containing protein [Planctomycetales bacterium]
TDQMTHTFESRIGPANHWSSSWVNAMKGTALAAAGKDDQAAPILQQSLLVAGQLDHPLTATVLLELGKIAYRQERYAEAITYFLESTYSAAVNEDVLLIEEALERLTTAHIASGAQTPIPALVTAAEWARREKLRATQAKMVVLAAEVANHLQNPVDAARYLGEFEPAWGRRSPRTGWWPARYQFEMALVEYQRGNAKNGNLAVQAAIGAKRAASPWLFQIEFVGQQFVSRTFSDRVANQAYALLLRDPTTNDWLQRPLETITVLRTPREPAFELWLAATLSKQELPQALVVSDYLRRHRFHMHLPHGGRLLGLRWILEAPSESLSATALQQRQDILTRYPQYRENSERIVALQAKLRELASAPSTNADEASKLARETTSVAKELHSLGQQQEAKLAHIALRREPAELVFPPALNIDELQQRLPEGSLVLSFVSTPMAWHAFMMSSETGKFAHWEILQSQDVEENLVKLLRSLGSHDTNSVVNEEVLRSSAWTEPAAQLTDLLIDRRQDGFWTKTKELVVVPDGTLWYLPFELLRGKQNDTVESYVNLMRIRYAPTISLAAPDRRSRRRQPVTGIVLGKLFPGDDETVSRMEFDEWSRFVPGSTALPDRLPAPSGLLRSSWDHLVVFDDHSGAGKRGADSWEWSPVTLDAGKPGSRLADWLTLPWGGPELVMLPGFTSGAAQPGKLGDGSEVYQSITGLMASGTQTVLISRWRTGGPSAYHLSREFAQEVMHGTADEAWYRAIQLLRETEVDVEREPRVRWQKPQDVAAGGPILASHPFFWAGYLLADMGTDLAQKPE